LLGRDIECAPKTLRAACGEAIVGLRKLARGGLEVGGVLFGEHAEGLIRVLAVRPIECEHRFGPSFVLSDADHAALEALLEDSRSDPELASLEILGCYLSHSRHGTQLTEADIELCNRYFVRTDQIALILVPSLSGVVRGTFLTRDSHGNHVSGPVFEHSILGQLQGETLRSQPRAIKPVFFIPERVAGELPR